MRAMRFKQGCPTEQKGAYSVVIVAVLALLTLLASKVMTVATMDSVRLTNNTHASTESFYAAEAALAEAVVWLESNTPTYSGGATVSSEVTGTSVAYTTTKAGTDISRSYATVFWFEDGGDRIRVFARASSGDNQSVVSTWVDDTAPLKGGALDAPLTLAKCLLGTTGTPDVYADLGGGASYTTVATAACSSQPASIGSSCQGDPNSRRYGNLNCGQSNAFTETIVEDTSGDGSDLWDSMFAVTRASLKASATNDATSNIYWIESGQSLPSSQIAWDGSACTLPPAIVVIEGCPSPSFFTGGTRICGVVFVEPDPTDTDLTSPQTCSGNGWGNVEFYGTFAVNGNMDKLNANTQIYSAALAGFDGDDFPSDVVLVPGTWTDLETD